MFTFASDIFDNYLHLRYPDSFRTLIVFILTTAWTALSLDQLTTVTSTSPVTPTAPRPLLGEDGDYSELPAGPEPPRYQSGPEAV